MRPVCVLIGPPGSGKSSVGRALATRLGVHYRDTDADVERTSGMPIPEIFVEYGEPHFRMLEAEAVADALEEHDGVLALGGGAAMTPGIPEKLRGHWVVYLSVEVGEAVKRVGLASGRPLLNVNPRAQMRYLMEQRRPTYQRLATLTVATDGRTVDQVVDQIVAVLSQPVQEGQRD
ncbi:MAG TPA: shikimate kinase [Micromonosporaceae bacterium]|jgi:shikimate kinase|nr:shikimate kinase [Micromonosporaceae bacterium]